MHKPLNTEELGMVDDVYGAMMLSSPKKHRIVIRALMAFIVCFFVWSYFASLDVVTRGTGKVIPSSQVQIIQSLDGGILQNMYVTEGMAVKKGQPLARIDDTRVRSDLAQQEDEEGSLRANILRLQQEIADIHLNPTSTDWHTQIIVDDKSLVYPSDLFKDEPVLLKRQQAEYHGRLSELNNQLSILAKQIVQKEQENESINSQIRTLKNSLNLVLKELRMTQPMAQKGIVSEVESLKLQRQINDIKGELSKLYLQQPKTLAARDEAILKRREAALNYNKEARAKLNELESRLSRLTEAQVGVQDKVDRTVITSPVNGTIKTIHINTIGGVVKPGADIIEIVPTEDQLVIEAKIKPKDIAFLHPGLPAVVKVTAYNFTRYGGLDGTLEHISADTSQDKKGNSFYLVRIRTKHSQLIKKDGTPMPIIPGMLTTVDIISGKRTVLDYILNPILRAKDTAFKER
ncbi:HlyD family type I secretion periplasmic adaptor subunit [Photobacterium leiognathi]|uniref:HlyD family type I secretion periplasmic adaptor subunit n=1 Tax=Photobacterium leiognathi TaxID=553611 RepID=UPI002980CC86|nr:HlyD family type I secretion periplasmic adaptor subunit [Photobacterium leiognathi]